MIGLCKSRLSSHLSYPLQKLQRIYSFRGALGLSIAGSNYTWTKNQIYLKHPCTDNATNNQLFLNTTLTSSQIHFFPFHGLPSSSHAAQLNDGFRHTSSSSCSRYTYRQWEHSLQSRRIYSSRLGACAPSLRHRSTHTLLFLCRCSSRLQLMGSLQLQKNRFLDLCPPPCRPLT